MVLLASTESSLHMLLERLRWPVRLVRWRAAQEYGGLLSAAATSDRSRAVYLDWLSSRALETEVASGLAVLMCVPRHKRPSLSDICANINAPSILTDVMLQSMYGVGSGAGDWSNMHSGPPPASFVPDAYFDSHLGVQIAPAFSNQLSHIESTTKFPLMRQWAYEWHNLMEATQSPHSDFPYYFLDSAQRQAGFVGQFSQRQDDIFRSSYLKTLAYSVSRGMPHALAIDLAADALPVNPDFVQLQAVERPKWLASRPGDLSNDGFALDTFGRRLVKIAGRALGQRPISIKIPIAPEILPHAELRLTAVLATDNFKLSSLQADLFLRRQMWSVEEDGGFNRELSEEDPSKHIVRGQEGACLPLGLDLWPMPSGFWHHDYLYTGITLPASYSVEGPADVFCEERRLVIRAHRRHIGQWFVWHDHWTPLHPHGGHPRCGMVSTLDQCEINAASRRHGMKPGWVIDLSIWKSETQFSQLIESRRSAFFFAE